MTVDSSLSDEAAFFLFAMPKSEPKLILENSEISLLYYFHVGLT